MSEKRFDVYGNIQYLDEQGRLHREDGPAFICSNQLIHAWYYEGKLHRDKGPALISQLGEGQFHYEYYIHGKLHRINGPAVIRPRNNVPNIWYLDGKCLTEEKHYQMCMQKGLLKITLFEE